MYEPVFTEPPHTWQEWWICLRRFVSGWYGTPVGELGRWPAELIDLEATLGREVPPTIAEWSSLHADLEVAGCFAHAFRDDYALAWKPDLDAVTLLMQSEGDLYWATPTSALDADDPAVDAWLIDHDTEGMPDPSWVPFKPWTDSVTLFVLEHLVGYLRGPGGGFNVTIDDAPRVDELLAEVMPVRFDAGRLTIFEAQDAIITVGPTLWSAEDRPEVEVHAEIGESRRGTLDPLREEVVRLGRR